MLLRVDADGAPTRIPVGRGPSAVVVGESTVWVADALDDTVKPIDPATNSPITTIAVGNKSAERDRDRRRQRMGHERRRRHTDPRHDRVTASVKVGGSPQALVVVDGKVWVSVQAPPPAQPSSACLASSTNSTLPWPAFLDCSCSDVRAATSSAPRRTSPAYHGRASARRPVCDDPPRPANSHRPDPVVRGTPPTCR